MRQSSGGAACPSVKPRGGDVYARGNIRSIAKVAGTDSELLIREYDAVHRAPGALSAVSLGELVSMSVQAPQRRRLDLSTVWGVMAPAYASVRRRVDLSAVRGLVTAAYPAVRRRLNWAVVLALALGVVLGFGVDRVLAASQRAAVTAPAAGNHAVTRRLTGRGRVNSAPDTSQKAAAPSPGPAVAVKTLNPVSAAAFSAGGGQGDNPQLARLAIDAHSATGWHTDWYTSARFGNLYPGTGLLLDMGRAVTITSVRISLGRVSGADFQLRVGARPALADLPPAAHANNAGGVVRLRLTWPAHGRYVLVWFTRLPQIRPVPSRRAFITSGWMVTRNGSGCWILVSRHTR